MWHWLKRQLVGGFKRTDHQCTLALDQQAIGSTRKGKSIVADALIEAGAEDGDTVAIDRDGQARVISRRPRVIVNNTQ